MAATTIVSVGLILTWDVCCPSGASLSHFLTANSLKQYVPAYHRHNIDVLVNKDSNVITEECAIPNLAAPKEYDMSENCGDDFRQLMEEYKDLFCITPGKTAYDCHYIPTKGPPIHVPPRRIPGHYRQEVVRQIDLMLCITRGNQREHLSMDGPYCFCAEKAWRTKNLRRL